MCGGLHNCNWLHYLHPHLPRTHTLSEQCLNRNYTVIPLMFGDWIHDLWIIMPNAIPTEIKSTFSCQHDPLFMAFIKSCSIDSRNDQRPKGGAWNKAHFKNLLANTYHASTVSRALEWWSRGPGFKSQLEAIFAEFFFALLICQIMTEIRIVKNLNLCLEPWIEFRKSVPFEDKIHFGFYNGCLWENSFEA